MIDYMGSLVQAEITTADGFPAAFGPDVRLVATEVGLPQPAMFSPEPVDPDSGVWHILIDMATLRRLDEDGEIDLTSPTSHARIYMEMP